LKNTVKIVMSGTLLMMLLGIVYSFSFFRPFIMEEMNVTLTQTGYPFMTALFFFSVFMMIGGRLNQQYLPRHISYLGVILISIGYFISYITSNIIVLTLGYGLFIGAGMGLLYGLPLLAINHLETSKKGLLSGISLLGFGLSPILFAYIIETSLENLGVNQTFLLLMIINVPLLLFTTHLLTSNQNHEAVDISYKGIANQSFFILYILFFLVSFIGLTAIGLTKPLADDYGINTTEIVILTGFFAIMNGVGRPLFGWIHDHLGFSKTAQITFLGIILSSTTLAYFQNSLVFVIGLLIYYLIFGGWLSIAPSATRRLFGQQHFSNHYGVMFTAYGLGAILGTLSGSYILEATESSMLFYAYAIIGLIGLLVVNFFKLKPSK
jgi:OFA family oxalate/formate antiporter-like MFS transporter